MIRRKWLVGLAAFVLVALAVPGVALAAGKAFSASGTLVQTDAGDSVIALSSGLPGFPDGIPGRLTTDQKFTGELAESEWGALKNASVDVDPHNSFITFVDGVPDFAPFGTEAIVGVAFGAVELHKGQGNYLIATYGAGITGTLTVDPTCAVDPAVGLPLSVSVTDVGAWFASEQHGAFAQMGSSGTLVVTAEGCLGSETAALTIGGIR